MNISLIKIVYISILVLAGGQSLSAQENEIRHIIGIEGPVSINQNLLTGTSIDYIYAIRYGYQLNQNIIFGPELSGYYKHFNFDNASGLKDYGSHVGGYFRYSFIPEKRINPFIEGGLFWYYRHYIPGTSPVFDNVNEFEESKLSAYIAPGVSFISVNRRVSLDLMYQFANTQYVNGRNSSFSFKLNFHF
jgi:hypothetical protein